MMIVIIEMRWPANDSRSKNAILEDISSGWRLTAEDKHVLSQRITGLYRALPKFYVIVAFQEVAPESFYMGGEPAHNFVRIWVDHIARSFPPDAKKLKAKWMGWAEEALAPYIKDRGRDWEIHI